MRRGVCVSMTLPSQSLTEPMSLVENAIVKRFVQGGI